MAATGPNVYTNHGQGWSRENNSVSVCPLASGLFGIPSSNTHIDYLARPNVRLVLCSAPYKGACHL